MNLSVAFFHGVQGLMALVFASVIVVIAVPLAFYIWLRHTKSSELKLTYTYAVFMAVVCALMAFTRADSQSLFQLTVSTVAFILGLPWNAITLYAVSIASDSDIGEGELVAATLLGGGVNSVLLFYAAKRLRQWR